MGRELTTAEVLELLAELGQPVAASTWRSYVARGQAPGPIRYLGRDPQYDEDDVREWVQNRPGQGARTDLGRVIGTPIDGLLLHATTQVAQGREKLWMGDWHSSTLYRSGDRWVASYYQRQRAETDWRELTEAEVAEWRRSWT